MKSLTIKHAIRYCMNCWEKLNVPNRGVVNRQYLFEALSSICKSSSSASEIAGAGKLLDILEIIERGHEESARNGFPAYDLPPGTNDVIWLHVRQKVKMMEFCNQEEEYEGLQADSDSRG